MTAAQHTDTDIAALLADTRSDLDAIPAGPWEVGAVDSDCAADHEISVRAGTAITSQVRYLSRDMIAEWDVYGVYNPYAPDGGAEYQQRLAIAKFVAAAPAREARFIEVVERLLADNAQLRRDLDQQVFRGPSEQRDDR